MKFEWVPYSAAALVAGAIALAMGGLLMPDVGDSADSLRMVEEQGGRWLGVASLYFGSSVAMTVGLPVVLTLLESTGARRGLVGTGLLALGCIGTGAYAVLLVFFRALVLTGAVEAGGLGSVTDDVGLGAFLVTWVAAFYVGELLVAWGLFLAGTTPRWVPMLLLLHVVSLPLSVVLPTRVSAATVLLVAIGLCGVGITANHRGHLAR